jgi:hypothetical protein
MPAISQTKINRRANPLLFIQTGLTHLAREFFAGNQTGVAAVFGI